MAFSEATKQAAFIRAGGQCECDRLSCTVHKTLHCGASLCKPTLARSPQDSRIIWR